jgi:hypothetical protein
MAHIFISYKHEDQQIVARIAKFFEQLGLEVFWDHRLQSGEGWDTRIEQELEEAQCVILAWTALSRESRWVRNEGRRALERNVLVPALLEDIRLPLEFADVQCENLIGWNGEISHQGWMRLVERVSNMLGRHDIGVAAKLIANPNIDTFQRLINLPIVNEPSTKHQQTETADEGSPRTPLVDPPAPTIGDEDMTIRGFTYETLAEHLKDVGYRVELRTLDSGAQAIIVKVSGSTVVATLYPKSAETKTSVQFYVSYPKSERYSAEKLNLFNKNYRFAKVYEDNDGDPCMEMDWNVNGMSEDAFKYYLDMFEANLAAFKADVL